ncbi:MAG: hypothetical protein ACREJU_11305 [Nitrospiraceae bacterium]
MIIAKRIVTVGLLTLIVCTTTPVKAQQQDEAPMPPQETEGMNAANQMGGQMMGQSPEMQEMARAMKSMADMCQMMMQREAQLRPYWITAVCVVGVLLTVALVLFIVLEVQWVRIWNLRIKTERRNLG